MTDETRTGNIRDSIAKAELWLPSSDLDADLAFFTKRLAFRIETIFPADHPSVAVMSGYGIRLRLDRAATSGPSVLRLLCRDPSDGAGGTSALTAPNGTRIQFVEADPARVSPATRHDFVVSRLADGGSWLKGRAGMLYRDLIPGRLGGAVIASHIRIPDAGPVADSVHFHNVAFQLIYCYRGWVRLVYEDQGPAFVLEAGDCVIQPPQIRHRVLEASAGLEVIELTTPAEHITTMDHDMGLPNPVHRPDRGFSGQRFHRSAAADADWKPSRWPGFEAQETGIGAAVGGAASVSVLRPVGGASETWTRHGADILFGFVLRGTVTLRADGHPARELCEADAWVLPPEMKIALAQPSQDLRVLEVALPGTFPTTLW